MKNLAQFLAYIGCLVNYNVLVFASCTHLTDLKVTIEREEGLGEWDKDEEKCRFTVGEGNARLKTKRDNKEANNCLAEVLKCLFLDIKCDLSDCMSIALA